MLMFSVVQLRKEKDRNGGKDDKRDGDRDRGRDDRDRDRDRAKGR